jgi:hypothetical protein
MLTVNKNQAITKLNRLIEDGRQNAGRVIEHVMTHRPQDFIVKANALHPRLHFFESRARAAR